MLKDFAKSFLIYGFASGLSKALLVLLIPLYTSIFSPDDYGIIDILAGFTALMVILGMLQIESSVARYYYETEGENKIRFISTALWSMVVFSLFVSALLFLLADIISLHLFTRGDLSELLMLTCPLIPLSVAFSFLLVITRYEKKPVLYFIFIMLQVLLTIGSILFFIYYRHYGIKGVLYGQIAGVTFPLIMLSFYCKKLIKLQWSSSVLKRIMRYSLPMVPAVGIGWANTYFNRFVMLQYLSYADIGIYSLAARIASLFSLSELAFSLTWGPFFWNTYSEKKNHSFYFFVFNVTSASVFAFVAAASFFSEELVMLFSNVNYLSASEISGILFLSYSLPLFIQMVGMGPAIVRKTYYNPLLSLAGLLINLLLLFLFIQSAGIMGVACAALAGNMATVFLFWLVSDKLYPIGYSKLFFLGSFSIAAVLVMAGTLIPLRLPVKIILLCTIFSILTFFAVNAYKKMKSEIAQIV